jgi:hypothetical protein
VDQANDYVVPGDVGTDAAAWPAGSNGALDTSMARTSPSSSGVDPASWVDSSRSLNMDSPFTYELDGNTWTSGWLRNLQMTPGTHNDLRDGSGNMVFCASTMHTNVGNVATDGAASDICGDEVMYYSGDGSGNEAYVSYGPYLDGLTVGQWYQADYRIKVQNNAAGEKSLLLDSSVFPEGADNYEFYYLPTATLYKTYTVKFQKGVDNLHEFRVRTYNKSDIYVDSVTVKEITPPPSEITYQSEDMPSAIASTVISDAQASNGTARSGDTTGFLTFGPYSQDQIERGSYEATFYIKNEGGATGFVGAVDVFQSFGAESKSLAFNIIDDTEVATGSYTAVTLPFELVDQSQGSLEFRIKILQENTFVADKVVVTKV